MPQNKRQQKEPFYHLSFSKHQQLVRANLPEHILRMLFHKKLIKKPE